MGKAWYIGDSNYLARKMKKMYIGGADYKAHKVKKIYIGGADYKAHLAFSSSFSKVRLSANNAYSSTVSVTSSDISAVEPVNGDSNNVYAWGGGYSINGLATDYYLYIFNMNGTTITQTSLSFSSRRVRQISTLYDSKYLYKVGQQSSGVDVYKIRKSDLVEEISKTCSGVPLVDGTLCDYNSTHFLYGGTTYYSTGSNYHLTMYKMDKSTMTQTQIASFQQTLKSTENHSVINHDGKIYLISTYSAGYMYVALLNVESGTKTQVYRIQFASDESTFKLQRAIEIDGNTYLFLGSGSTATRCYLLDYDTGTLIKIGDFSAIWARGGVVNPFNGSMWLYSYGTSTKQQLFFE